MTDVAHYALRLANGETLESILREARLLAWDEGWCAQGEMSFDADNKPMMPVLNPYLYD